MTPETEERILLMIMAGIPQSRACELMEIDETTLQKHRKRHPEFSARYKEALADREILMTTKVMTGARGDKGCMWLLNKLSKAYREDKSEQEAIPVKIITQVKQNANSSPGTLPEAEPIPHEQGEI